MQLMTYAVPTFEAAEKKVKPDVERLTNIPAMALWGLAIFSR